MKVAIATDDEKNISAHFGRTRGFVVYEIENGATKSKEFRVNNFTSHVQGKIHAPHSTDKHAGILKALNDCQVVISNGMGRRIYDDLQSANIKAFIVNETNAEEALNLYLKNELQDNPDKGCEH